MTSSSISGQVRAKTAWVAALVAVLALGANKSLVAQPDAGKPKIPDTVKPTPKSHPNEPHLWDVDQMMDDAVIQISRRYNLNKAQENYTRLILVKRVREFLSKYESDVRQLLKESFDMRMKGSKPEDLRSWAERAQPIYEAAMTAILEGNAEWGDILDPEQKKIHERDLAQMHASFDSVNRMLDTWKGGKGITPIQPNAGAKSQEVVPQQRVSPIPAVAVPDVEDEWLQYVNKFIEAYGLDNKQDVAARSIYEEQRKEAKKYRNSKKKQFAFVAKQIRDAKGNDALRSAEDLMYAMETPIRKMFVELEQRLNASLTSEQSNGIASDQKKALQILADEYSGRNKTKRSHRITMKPRPDPDPDSKAVGGSKDTATTKPAADAKTAASGKTATSRPKEPDPVKPVKTDKPPKGDSKQADPAKSGGSSDN